MLIGVIESAYFCDFEHLMYIFCYIYLFYLKYRASLRCFLLYERLYFRSDLQSKICFFLVHKESAYLGYCFEQKIISEKHTLTAKEEMK